MAECIKCEISYDYGKKFCKNCGSQLIESKDILDEAKNLLKLQKNNEALKELEKIPSFSFFRDNADFHKIKILYKNKEYSKAEQLIVNTDNSQTKQISYKNLTNEDKLDFFSILLSLGTNYVAKDEVDKGISFLRSAEELSPEISKEKLGEAYLSIGKYYFEKNDFNNATESLLKSRDFGNEDTKVLLAKVYYSKAQKYYDTGNIKSSAYLIEKAITLRPEEKAYSELLNNIKGIKKEKQEKMIKVILSIAAIVLLAIIISIVYNSIFSGKTELAKTKFSEQDVKNKVEEYLQKNTESSIDKITALYGTNIDFYKNGIINKSFLRKNKKKYFSKWPNRKITLLEAIEVKPDTINETWEANFQYHYQLSNANRKIKGNAWCKLIYKTENNSLFIISEKGGNSKKINEFKRQKTLLKKNTSRNDSVILNIRNVFKTINNNIEQYDVKSIALNESTEGGTLSAYLENGEIIKIEVKHFGEMGKLFFDYYFSNGTLVFAFSQNFNYNIPMYMKGSKISEIVENRYYFHNHQLYKWLDPNKEEVSKSFFEEKGNELNRNVFELKQKIQQN